MKHDTLIMYGLMGLSVLTSFFLTFYGMNVVMAETAQRGAEVFAYVAIAYGLGNLAVLSIAWTSRESWAEKAIMLFALCFLGVFIMDMMRKGVQVESLAGLLVLGVVMLGNWLAVKKVVERE